jgi:hypothetical protein
MPVELGGLLMGGWVGSLRHVFASVLVLHCSTYIAPCRFFELSKCMTVSLFYHNMSFGILLRAC